MYIAEPSMYSMPAEALCPNSKFLFHFCVVRLAPIRVFNRNLSRWQNFRSRQRMNYLRRRRMILGGSRSKFPRKILKIWAS